MLCLTDSETQNWLRQHSIPEDPYERTSSHRFYLQFYAPVNHRKIDAFVRHYYEQIILEEETLIHMKDWELYEQSEMITITRIRSQVGEKRMLIDAPGHILTSGEKDFGISLFSLSASFAWSSYLYSSTHHSTIFNWEGEVFDFWTDSKEVMSMMKFILKQFNLAETNQR